MTTASQRVLRVLRRIGKDWETEIARPIVVALATASVAFLFSLLFAPVRRFLFTDTVPYPIYCTAETYSTSGDFRNARTEFLLINTTDRKLSRADLQKALATGGADQASSPDIRLVYTRGLGRVAQAAADQPFNEQKGIVDVRQDGSDVIIQPQQFEARAILRVNIDVTGLDADAEITRAAHAVVPFRIESYEDACYTR